MIVSHWRLMLRNVSEVKNGPQQNWPILGFQLTSASRSVWTEAGSETDPPAPACVHCSGVHSSPWVLSEHQLLHSSIAVVLVGTSDQTWAELASEKEVQVGDASLVLRCTMVQMQEKASGHLSRQTIQRWCSGGDWDVKRHQQGVTAPRTSHGTYCDSRWIDVIYGNVQALPGVSRSLLSYN